ncbi:MAG: hypothetical protein ACI4SG_05930 [Oligosphaeraceae bacterium]
MKKIAVFLILVGAVLFGIGMSMREKRLAVTRTIEGNSSQTAAAGAAVGVVSGGVAGATIGGIGLALCGTAVGIPAGLVCLGAAGLCGLIGGSVGAACGTPDQNVTELIHAYSPGEYWTVISIGAILVCLGLYMVFFSKSRKVEKEENPQNLIEE